MPRRSMSRIAAPVALAVLLVLGIAAPAFACSERLAVLAADDIDAAATGTAVSAITPGSVNRTSLNLSATYSVGLTLNYASRSFMVNSIATITNTSGGPIDRIELNTVAARLGGMSLRVVQVDGRNVARRVERPDDRRAARRHPRRRRHGEGPYALPRAAAELAVGLELAVHEGERDRRRLPLDPVGEPCHTVQPAEPR